jgi:LacI family transcriptional regulator
MLGAVPKDTDVVPPRSPKPGRVTMNDVAALAGVGLKTVSRVMNGEPNVSPAMVERVTAAARKLRYQPDLIASALRRSGRTSLSLGFLISAVENPFPAAVHRAVMDVASAHGVVVLAAATEEDPEREQSLIETFLARRVDGLVIAPTAGAVRYLPEICADMPVVMVDRSLPGVEADSVVSDNRASAARATRHLLAHGHRRIAVLSDLGSIQTAAERTAGVMEALSAGGIPAATDLWRANIHGTEAAYDVTLELLASPKPPTAILSLQNLITLGVLRALRATGRQRSIALVSFDDFDMADLLDPPLTAVAQDPHTIGRTAAERFFARLNGDTSPVSQTVIPTQFIVRGSGEIAPPGRDTEVT